MHYEFYELENFCDVSKCDEPILWLDAKNDSTQYIFLR